nr:ankyrin repeat domain-containing protein [uncultured Roseateles sp.]
MRYLKFLAYLAVAIGFSSVRAGELEDFFTAIARNDGRAVMTLMIRGVNPNARDAQGNVGLVLALREESLKAVDSLMQYPALDVNAANAAGETPLMMAALRGHPDWVKKLLVRGAQINRPGWTPLHYAASAEQGQSCVELLIKEGAELDARSPNGSTALMLAARYGMESAVDALLKAGADRQMRNEKGLSALDFAHAAGREYLYARLTAP